MTQASQTLASADHCNILLDLETLATTPTAAITEVAAICYDSCESFSRIIDPSQLPPAAFFIDQETIKFHNTNRKLHDYVNFLEENGSPPALVAGEFVDWCYQQAKGRQIQIWCQGTDFDIPILRHFLSFYSHKFPCRHDAVRDVRTLAKLFPEIPYIKGKHTALDDVSKMHQHIQKLVAYSPAVEKQFHSLNWTE